MKLPHYDKILFHFFMSKKSICLLAWIAHDILNTSMRFNRNDQANHSFQGRYNAVNKCINIYSTQVTWHWYKGYIFTLPWFITDNYFLYIFRSPSGYIHFQLGVLARGSCSRIFIFVSSLSDEINSGTLQPPGYFNVQDVISSTENIQGLTFYIPWDNFSNPNITTLS